MATTAASRSSGPSFYGEGEISFSAGRKEKFLGRDVAPVEWSNIARVASRDEVKKLPGYFGLYGRARIFGLDIADADFTYYFGVGAQFGLRMGIGFPSGRNDPASRTTWGWVPRRHLE